MTDKLAVAIQLVATFVAVIAAGFFFDSWWASVLVAAVVSFAVGNALEGR